MWYKQPWFIYFGLGLVVVITSAAPSEKRTGNENHHNEAKVVASIKFHHHHNEPVKDFELNDEDDNFFPTMDKAGKKHQSKTNCKDNGNGKCADSLEETIDQLLHDIKVIAEKNKVNEEDRKELRELVEKLTVKVHELQNECKGHSKGQIAEIEHRHTVERKIGKKAEHDLGNEPHLNGDGDSHGHGLSPSQSNPAGPTLPPAINFVSPDVNYNGGFNKPMEKLKQLYPHGHWPDEDDVNDPSETVGAASLSISPTDNEHDHNMADLENAYYDYPSEGTVGDGSKSENNGVDEGEGENNYDHFYVTKDEELTPEYLESIIRNQRKYPSIVNDQQKHHHRQEHELVPQSLH